MVKSDIWGIVLKPACKAPKQCVVKSLLRHALQRDVLKTRGPDLVEPGRKLVSRDLTFLGTKAQVKTAVTRPVRLAFTVDVQGDYAFAAVKCNCVEQRRYRGDNVLAAYARDL